MANSGSQLVCPSDIGVFVYESYSEWQMFGTTNVMNHNDSAQIWRKLFTGQ